MTADKLDEMFGDPWDEANPVGYAAILEADERGELPVAASRLLEDYGLGAEFIPAELGGRFVGVDELTAILRTIWRRDPRLGIAYGHAGSRDTGTGRRLSGLRGLEVGDAEPALSTVFLPSLLVGPLDTALRTGLANSFDRRLYGATVADIPFVRASIARAYADLLAIETLPPGTEHLAARIVLEAFSSIREVLGARALLRSGPTAIFQKTARDVAAVISLQPRQNPVTRAQIRELLPKLAEPELLAVRDRLARRLGEAPVLTPAEREDVDRQLFDIAAARYHDRRLFDSTARRIPG